MGFYEISVCSVLCSLFCRYPDDPFDRYWFAQGTNSTYLQAATPLQALSITQPIANTKNDSFYVPWPVLQSGLQLPAPGNMTVLPFVGPQLAAGLFNLTEVCLHFAELDPTANITSREFFITVPRPTGPQVVVENAFNYTNPPAPYAANTWYIWDLLKSGPSTSFTFTPTVNAVKGPIINGMELFSISEPVDVRMTTDRDGELSVFSSV